MYQREIQPRTRSSLDCYFEQSDANKKKFQSNREILDRLLEEMKQEGIVLTMEELARRGDFSKGWISANWAYKTAYKKAVEEIRLTQGTYGEENSEDRKEVENYLDKLTGKDAIFSDDLAPAVKKKRASNLHRLESTLNKMLEQKISDPNEWTYKAIATRMGGVARNYINNGNTKGRKLVKEAKAKLQEMIDSGEVVPEEPFFTSPLIRKSSASHQAKLKRLRALLDRMVEESVQRESRWTYKYLAKDLDINPFFFSKGNPEARRMVSEARAKVFPDLYSDEEF